MKFTGTRHLEQPDYSRELPEPCGERVERLSERLTFLYGQEVADQYLPELLRILKVYQAYKSQGMIERPLLAPPSERFTQRDVILITYGDILDGDGESPLTTLARFCDEHLGGAINTLHILPFFPYSSDRGFSVIDFEQVDPRLGSWEDIHALEGRYNLMFDGVINHVSAKSRWFQEFLNGSRQYADFFTHYDSPEELTREQRELIFRPRTSDVLTRFDTINGPKWVWTTFSDDQIDLNFKNPAVLMKVIGLLLLYVRHGADVIRLDAVTYLWAEAGTRCIHLEQTHQIVKLLRDALELVAPHVALITETNVPHDENVSYFGNGYDEAHMVYNFALPPLTLHAFYAGDATRFSDWAQGLETGTSSTTFFNFLDSHDGIGLMGARGVLPDEEIEMVVQKARDNGALVSYKTGTNGAEDPYELNTTWFSALNDEESGEDLAFQIRRYVASRSVALVLQGVPGIYMHGLMGTRNDMRAVERTHVKREINRTVIDFKAFVSALNDPLSKTARMGRELGRLIALRVMRRAFHPNGPQRILRPDPRVLSVMRFSPEGTSYVLALINVSNKEVKLEIPLSELHAGGYGVENPRFFDFVNEMESQADKGVLYLSLSPYDVMWLEEYVER